MPFPLGRPLGSSIDPEFQKGVMRAAFDLLETATEPTIDDYPLDSPDDVDEADGPWACPLNLGPIVDDTPTGRLLAEIARLRPWAAQTRTARGRTLFGASGAGPDRVDDVARALGAIAEGADLDVAPEVSTESPIEWAFDMPILVRHLADDLRTHYHEAIASQPGNGNPDHDDLNDWIFGVDDEPGTALGEVLMLAADHLTKRDDPMANLVRGLLIPEGRFRGGSAF